jgi:integrase/recombinase XerD
MPDHSLLGHWVRRFLLEYAASERNLSANTRASYRDMLILLLPYVAKQRRVAIDALLVSDLSSKVVRSFLAYLERERHCCTATRNQRLGSIHALARFIGEHSPEHVDWCAQIRLVPFKKGTTVSLTYLEKAEMDALLAAPDRSSKSRLRAVAAPLQYRCPSERSCLSADWRYRLGLEVRLDYGKREQTTPLSALARYPRATTSRR